MDMGSLLGNELRTMLIKLQEAPPMSNFNGPVLSLMLTVAHIGICRDRIRSRGPMGFIESYTGCRV